MKSELSLLYTKMTGITADLDAQIAVATTSQDRKHLFARAAWQVMRGAYLMNADRLAEAKSLILAIGDALGLSMPASADDIATLEDLVEAINDVNNNDRCRYIEDYLYEMTIDDYSFDEAQAFADKKYRLPLGACSCCRNGNFIGRNYDWKYDATAIFAVHVKAKDGRHGSIGTCASISDLTDEAVKAGTNTSGYGYIPVLTLDGINDCHLFAELNIVPTGDRGLTTGTNPGAPDLSVLCMPRFVLDNASTVDEAISMLQSHNIYAPNSEAFTQELHMFICDMTQSAEVEFIDNEMVVTRQFINDKPIATNFYLHGFDGNTSTAFYNPSGYDASTTTLTPHAEGIERYDILSDNYDMGTSEDGMRALMKKVYFGQMYQEGFTPWYSEVLAYYPNRGDITIDSPATDIDPIIEIARSMYDNRTRESNDTWQTVFMTVYDIENMTMNITVQEQDSTEGHRFGI